MKTWSSWSALECDNPGRRSHNLGGGSALKCFIHNFNAPPAQAAGAGGHRPSMHATKRSRGSWCTSAQPETKLQCGYEPSTLRTAWGGVTMILAIGIQTGGVLRASRRSFEWGSGAALLNPLERRSSRARHGRRRCLHIFNVCDVNT
jgi:hypothetical protein